MRKNKERNAEVIALHSYIDLFRMTQEELASHITNVLRNRKRDVNKHDGYVISKGSYPVMLVCHMDTVHKEPVRDLCMSGDGKVLMSPQGIGGDDRCGVMMALEISKEYDCTLLFCADEEVGSLGAKDFVKDGDLPDVNYIVEMDRRGNNDCVFYNCSNADFEEFVESVGFKTAQGSFSDICVLAPAMETAAVNISAGYYNEHTTYESVDLSVVADNIKRIKKLLAKPCDKFEYVERADEWKGSAYYRNYQDALRAFGGGYIDGYYDYDDYSGLVYRGTEWLLPYDGAIIRGKSCHDANGSPYTKKATRNYLVNYDGEIFTYQDDGQALVEEGLYADGDEYLKLINEQYDNIEEYDVFQEL